MRRAWNFKDITGMTFNNLTVVSRAEGRGTTTKAYWNCICSCGKKTVASGEKLRLGRTKSCGCLQGSALPPGQAAFNRIFERYVKQSIKRKLVFSISKSEFKSLITQPCHYCGDKPNRKVTGHKVKGNTVYNGLDRIDNLKGYVLNNVVPCCLVCNRAKNSMSYADFTSYISRMVDFFKSKK